MNIQKCKLTRKYFRSLQSNLYLVSNTARRPDEPCFAEHVETNPEDRDAQWKRIVAARVDQISCMVFINKQQWINFVQQFHLVQKYPSALTLTRLLGIDPPRPSNSVTIRGPQLSELLPENFAATVERFKAAMEKQFNVEPLMEMFEAMATKHNVPDALAACSQLRIELGLPKRAA
jgi:hypothetical protein